MSKLKEMPLNMNFSIIFLILLFSCGKENELIEHDDSSITLKKDQKFSKNPIKVFDEIKLNDPIVIFDLSYWKLLNENPEVNDRTKRYSYNSTDEDLSNFYNLKFDDLEIKTFNDSIFQLKMKVSGPEFSNYSANDKTVKREQIDEALKIFEEKYGSPSIDLSTNDQNVRKIWSKPDFSIEIAKTGQIDPH